MNYSFAFQDRKLQERLIAMVNDAKIPYEIDNNKVIHYSSDLEEVIGNQLISSIRSSIFPKWMTLSCPAGWIGQYIEHMKRHNIAFQVEIRDGKTQFLIPGKHRPHAWRISPPDSGCETQDGECY